MRFIFACSLLVACGSEPTPPVEIDPALRPILERYLAAAPDAGTIGELRRLGFGDLPPLRLGECAATESSDGVERAATIRRGLPDWYTEVIVLHELLHCVHGRSHVENPGAIMYRAPKWDSAYWEANLDKQLAAAFAGEDT